MTQLTVKELRQLIEGVGDDLPVFFRRVAPIAGNIEEAGTAIVVEYGFFGLSLPCLIIEPMAGDEEE